MRKETKKFIVGLTVLSIIVFSVFLYNYIVYNEIELFSFFVLPFLFYLIGLLAFKFTKTIYNKKIVYITKYFGIIAFLIFAFLKFLEEPGKMGLSIYFLSIVISYCCNWNIEPEKQKLIKEDNQEKENQIQYYLINFLFLIVIYIVSAMIYYRQTGDQSDRWIMILVCAICLPVSFWGLYLFYRFILKRNKATTVYKIFMIFICGYLIYTFSSTKQRFIDHLLIIIDIVSLISITVQDLVLNRKIQNNKSEDSKKCLT